MAAVSDARAAWRSMRGNASLVLGERAVFGLVNLAAAAVAVHAIGFEAFGAVVLCHAYARLIGDALRFQSWQAVLRFGAPALAEGRTRDFERLIGLTLRLDLIALAGSLAIAVAGAGVASELFQWPEATARWAPWYAISIVFMISATPTGLLRLFDRFGVLAAQHAANALIRLLGALAVWAAGLGAEALIAVWFAAATLSGAWMIANAFAAVRAHGATPRLGGRWRELARGFDGFWGFVLATNASTTLAAALTNATTLVVGAALGPAAAALYAVARQLADAIAKPAKLLGPVIFPEISRLRSVGHRQAVDGLVLRALAAGGVGVLAVGAVTAFAGKPLLVGAFGQEALAAYDLMVLAAAAAALAVWGFPLEPAMVAAGRPGLSLAIQAGATAVYAVALTVGLAVDGLMGVGIALLVHAGLVFAGRLAAVWALRRD